MSGTREHDGRPAAGPASRRRPRQDTPRPRTVRFDLTEDEFAELEPPLRGDGSRDFRRLFGLLNQPHDALGKWGFRRPVWHLAMRAAPRDKILSDDEWMALRSICRS